MRIYISVDLEGIHGIDRYDDYDFKDPDYRAWKKYAGEQMLEEVSVVCDALVKKGTEDILVFESHGGGDTLHIPKNLPNVTQVHLTNDADGALPGLTSDCDGILLWGYHVKSGSINGKLAHTSSRRIKRIKINSRAVGEAYLHGLYAASFQVPLLAVSGDYALQNEISADIGAIPFFNSNTGSVMKRADYLDAIRSFIDNLDLDAIQSVNDTLNWPESTVLEIEYRSGPVNVLRYFLRKQYRFARLKGPSTCVYTKGAFVDQWNRYNGI